MRTRGIVVVAALAAVALASCKKTVEGETKSWERNTQKVQELTVLYPAFGAALKEQLKKAQEAMDAAKAITDQQQSAKKMAEANALLGSGFVYTLRRRMST
jgi:predicted small secreted protein